VDQQSGKDGEHDFRNGDAEQIRFAARFPGQGPRHSAEGRQPDHRQQFEKFHAQMLHIAPF